MRDHRGQNHPVTLRKFPYPYRAALAICSDIDGCTSKVFLEVHRYLNLDFGLPVADSFWGKPFYEGEMAYFRLDGQTISPDAPLIRQAIRDGLIDSLHSWGDFTFSPPEPSYLRRLAERLTEELSAHDLPIKIWINHGDDCNWQNLRTRLQPHFQGDEPQSPYYTVDLMRKMGIDFCWSAELVPWPLSGNLKVSSPMVWPKLVANAAKRVLRSLLGQKKGFRTSAELLNLMHPFLLADGTRFISFSRFNSHPEGIWGLPTRHTLRYALNLQVLDNLIKQEGYLLLYAHFGFPRNPVGDLFPREDRQALAGLAQRYRSGQIWVARTVDLLTYFTVHQHLDWKSYREGERTIIDIESIRDPIWGPQAPTRGDLAGLCYYTLRPEKTVIRLNGEELETIQYGLDHTGRQAIGFPPASGPDTGLL